MGHMVKLNHWFKEKAATLEPPVELLDTTGMSIEEASGQVARWIDAKIGGKNL